MQECQALECALPAFTEGYCYGHLQLTPGGPTDDAAVCIECGAASTLAEPVPMALYDRNMPGELLCNSCANRLHATLRVDDEGYNY